MYLSPTLYPFLPAQMQTTDTGLLFQTSADVASSASRDRKVKAAEKIGNPIRLSSKILDLCIHGDVAFTAESGWIARKIDLNVRAHSEMGYRLINISLPAHKCHGC
jgi:hypothetical protein